MAIQTTSNLSNSIRAQYVEVYQGAARVARLYDQLAMPVPGLSMEQATNGSSVEVRYLSSMAPGTTTISQTADVVPQTLVDATGTVTPTSRWGALQWAEAVDIQAFTNYGEERFRKLGENQVETLEILARDAATQGSWVERYTTRDALDAGTPAHRASDSDFSLMQGLLASLKVEPFVNEDGSYQMWGAIMHPWVFHDIRESGNVDAIGTYQDMGIHLNYEIAQIGKFRLVESPFAKVFGGAGADCTAGTVATTLSSAAARLDTTIVTTANVASSIAYGKLWTIGTEETTSTNYPDNERIKVHSATTYTLTISGEGENGGLKYAHAAGAAVRNADSVYTIIFGGPFSMAKVFVPEIGEFGQVVGPKEAGILEQFTHIGWKWYGGYTILVQRNILRKEVSVSYEH